MFHKLWEILLYQPLVNLLAFLVYIIPGGDIGLAIIALTLLVKIALFPLSHQQIMSQAKMTLMQPELNKIKQSGASREEQAKQTFEVYKKYNANPFSGCLLIFIQIPIIFALYFVFLRGLSFDSNTLYSFVPHPGAVNTLFLGLLDLSKKSLLLAILAGLSQYSQAHFMPKPTMSGENTFSDSFSRSMHIQMRYFFPVLIAFFAYSLSGAIALYWITSNIFATFQQIYANRKRHLILNSHNG